MILLPAVDIRDGKAVRLRQGHFDDETVYADDPLEAARSFVEAGARFLHIVDLDGAREGEPANLHHVERITSELDVPVELGGGLRSIASIRRALAAGASRVVLGTAAFTDPDLLDEALSAFTSRILVGVDVRGGMVSVAGWTRETQVRGEDAIRRMQQRGVTRFVYTNVDRDGMLEGPDLDEVRRVSEAVRGRFLYSGGIGSIDDLRALREMRLLNLAGVISGKALYEGRFGVARGPGGARAPDAPAPRDPVPRRGQGPRGQGRRVREPARRRGPGRAGRALPGGGRGRDRLPRHHRVAREARDRGAARAPLRRRRVHPVHDRRRRALGGGRPGGARRRRRQGLGELRGGGAPRAAVGARRGVRRPVRGAGDRRAARGRRLATAST